MKGYLFISLLLAASLSAQTHVVQPSQGGTGVANTATQTLGTSNINWATLGTGIVINTTTTGAKSVIAPSGAKCYPFQGSGGTGCDVPSSGSIGTINMPAAIFGGTPCTSSTCTFTLNTQQNGYIWGGVPPGFLTPILVNSTSCAVASAGTSASCTINAVNPGDLLFVSIASNAFSSWGGAGATDNHSATYTQAFLNASIRTEWGGYTPNVTGGNTTITVSPTSGSFGADIIISIMEFANAATASPLDVVSINGTNCGGQTFPSLQPITTTNAHDFIVADIMASNFTVTPGAGWQIVSQTPGSTVAVGWEMSVVNSVGTYTPTIGMVPNCPGSVSESTVAFKAAASGGATAPAFMPLSWSFLTTVGGAFPGAVNVAPSSTSGDTQIDVHVGSPINANAVTSAYAGNNSASTLYAVPTLTGAGAAFDCEVYLSCHSSTSTATVIPSLLWTDESNTAETLAGTTATCTTLGTNSVSSQSWPIRAKSATTIYLKTTIANGPSYDVHAHCSQSSNQ